MSRLIVMTPDGGQHEQNLRAINTLGRHPEQTVQILDRVVSKEHALITFTDGDYWLQDIGSRTGRSSMVFRFADTRLKDGTPSAWGGSIFFVGDSHESRVRQLSGNVTIHAMASETAIVLGSRRSRLSSGNSFPNPTSLMSIPCARIMKSCGSFSNSTPRSVMVPTSNY